MKLSRKLDWFKDGDNQPTFKYHKAELNIVEPRSIETYIIYKEQLPGRGKSMKTLCGLITVLLILGPVWMGMMFAVDAPQSEDAVFTIDEGEPTQLEDHGTRGQPEEDPYFIRLYFHRQSSVNPEAIVMNTSDDFRLPTPGNAQGATTFVLEEPFNDEMWMGDPQGEAGMMANVYLSGLTGDSVTLTVTDNEGGTELGTATYIYPSLHASTVVPIAIPFHPQFDHNYTFSAGHSIVMEATFTGNAAMGYDYDSQQSYLRLYCKPVTDIEIGTFNFNNEPSKTYYPNNIHFPINRRIVNVEGEVTDVFLKWDGKYIRDVDIEIEYPGGSVQSDNTSIDKGSVDNRKVEFSYTWEYNLGAEHGEYTISIIVTDEQDNLFTARNTFNMSQYGVLLTSPDQVGGEGSYTFELAKAKRNVIQYNKTTYKINVRNIGNAVTTVNMDSTGPSSVWEWGLWGENLTGNDGSESDTTTSINPGDKREIQLVVDSKGSELGKKATVTVTATSVDDNREESILTTVTTVVVKYDVIMKFSDGTKTKEETVEVGEDVIYDFKITNAGGADDVFQILFSTLPSGWSKTLTGNDLQTNHHQYGEYYVELTSGDSSDDFTLTLTTAPSGDLTDITVKITARSWGSKEQNDDPIVSDEVTTITTLTTGIMLEVVGTPEKETDPDDAVNFELKLTNPSSTQADYTVYLTLLGDSNGWEDADISFESGPNIDEKQYTLGAGDSSSFYVWAEPTLDVLAKNYTIQVHAERDDDPTVRFVEKNVYVIVREFHHIVVTSPLDLDDEAEPGDDVQYMITLENRGNVPEWVTILVTAPKDWTVDFGNASDEWSKEVQPGDIEEITITLGVPDEAEGDETVDVTISVVPASSDPVQVLTHTKIDATWYQPIFMLLVPIGLFIAILVLVAVIFRRR